MNEEKDWVYYQYLIDKDCFIEEHSELEQVEELKGLKPGGFTDSDDYVNLKDFNLEELICTCHIVEKYLNNPTYKNKSFSNFDSFGLKSRIGELLKLNTNNRMNYVSNGTLILAMFISGYRIERILDSRACHFNLSKVGYKNLAYNRDLLIKDR